MITINCSMCGEELKKPGALLFSPPVGFNINAADESMVWKAHVCVTCWDKLKKLAFPEKSE